VLFHLDQHPAHACRIGLAREVKQGEAMSTRHVAGGFATTTQADPHIQRRRDILRAHPEVRTLFGPNHWSLLLTAMLVALQLWLAGHVCGVSLWQVVALAALVGAYLSASLFAMIHDASHRLIFSSRAGNYWAACLANVPLVMWSAMPFIRYHFWHHRALGDYRCDVGVPTDAEASWVGNTALRKALWLAFFPVFQAFRTRKFLREKPYWHGWMLLNAGIQLAVNLLIAWQLGWHALLYLGLSIFFALGFHPLGTRVVQEHFVLAEGQETNNFSGWANLFECNFGYHIEHHDFPNISWNRLPHLQKMAPEFYVNQVAFTSRMKLMWQFIFDPSWSVYRNTIRLQARPPSSQPNLSQTHE
jgi:sphingolipid delta-4 desaturase